MRRRTWMAALWIAASAMAACSDDEPTPQTDTGTLADTGADASEADTAVPDTSETDTVGADTTESDADVPDVAIDTGAPDAASDTGGADTTVDTTPDTAVDTGAPDTSGPSCVGTLTYQCRDFDLDTCPTVPGCSVAAPTCADDPNNSPTAPQDCSLFAGEEACTSDRAQPYCTYFPGDGCGPANRCELITLRDGWDQNMCEQATEADDGVPASGCYYVVGCEGTSTFDCSIVPDQANCELSGCTWE